MENNGRRKTSCRNFVLNEVELIIGKIVSKELNPQKGWYGIITYDELNNKIFHGIFCRNDFYLEVSKLFKAFGDDVVINEIRRRRINKKSRIIFISENEASDFEKVEEMMKAYVG